MLSSAWNSMRTDLGTIEFLVVLPIVGAVYAVVITVLHLQFPRPDGVDWRGLLPGALLVGIGVAAMQALVLGYIAHKLSSSNELYGGIGTAIASAALVLPARARARSSARCWMRCWCAGAPPIQAMELDQARLRLRELLVGQLAGVVERGELLELVAHVHAQLLARRRSCLPWPTSRGPRPSCGRA